VEPTTPDSDRTSDVFLRHVAHDLRASLNVVVSWGELVKAGQLSPADLARAGETIVGHARHLSQRLTDALDVWRLDITHLDVVTRPSAVAAAVRSAVDLARPQFEIRRVECGLALHADGVAVVDAQRLVQALVALLENAAANTLTEHRVDVSVDVEGGSPVVRVVGGGRMPGATAFTRNPEDAQVSAHSRPFDFGLALARALIERTGGALDVEAVGDRVAFVVRLPPAPVQR
jgi:K+-sensing histidine kinase KdpD